MCGICALHNFSEIDISSIQHSLYHRGPDAQTDYQDNHVRLIHTRLSIQDIKNGGQPFKIENYVIIFNGEIYNHQELRKLIKNYSFKTNSDTETLLILFIQYGKECLKEIDGMFSFLIYDKTNKKFIFARDRVGKKPLYFYSKDHKFFLASELNVFIENFPELEIDEDSIVTFLRLGFIPGSFSPFKDLNEVLPGHYYEYDIVGRSISLETFFNLTNFYSRSSSLSKTDALDLIDETLNKSIKNRLISSDHEVGIFLSGGIDSSLIAAKASSFRESIKTFTIKFDHGFDESIFAKKVSTIFNTEHYEIPLNFNLKEDFEGIISNYGEPFMDSSAIPSYYVSREAKKYVNVAFNGDGADELFGGYRRYVPYRYNLEKIIKKLSFILPLLSNPKKKVSYYNYIHRLLRLSKKSGLARYSSATNDIFEDIFVFPDNRVLKSFEESLDSFSSLNLSTFNYNKFIDILNILPCDLLKKMDIASMSNSLETRSPFLSKYFLEELSFLNERLLVKNFTTKSILREYAKNILPREIVNSPKMGFEVPLNKWVNFDLKDIIFDSLQIGNYSEKFIDRKTTHSLLNNTINVSEVKRDKALWTLLCLNTWHSNLRSRRESKKFEYNFHDIKLSN